MNNLKSQIQALTEAEFLELTAFVVGEERTRRQNAKLIEEKELEMVQDLWKSEPGRKPDFATTGDTCPAYKSPKPKWESYPPAARVTHDGKSWENATRSLASGVPGEDPAWRELKAKV